MPRCPKWKKTGNVGINAVYAIGASRSEEDGLIFLLFFITGAPLSPPVMIAS